MKVWIVQEHNVGAGEPVMGVFSSKEKAEDYVRTFGGSYNSIEEFEVDEPLEE